MPDNQKIQKNINGLYKIRRSINYPDIMTNCFEHENQKDAAEKILGHAWKMLTEVQEMLEVELRKTDETEGDPDNGC